MITFRFVCLLKIVHNLLPLLFPPPSPSSFPFLPFPFFLFWGPGMTGKADATLRTFLPFVLEAS